MVYMGSQRRRNCTYNVLSVGLNVKKSTNLSGLYGELGRVPVIVYRIFNIITYWNKLSKSNETSIPRKIYDMLENDANNNITVLTGLFNKNDIR